MEKVTMHDIYTKVVSELTETDKSYLMLLPRFLYEEGSEVEEDAIYDMMEDDLLSFFTDVCMIVTDDIKSYVLESEELCDSAASLMKFAIRLLEEAAVFMTLNFA